MIKGISVTLIERIEVGKDAFNTPIYEEQSSVIANVLVSPTSQDDIISQMNLTGKKAVYTLAIPKGDNHIWEDSFVEFFGERFHVFTPMVKGIDEMIPLSWNGKVMVEKYG